MVQLLIVYHSKTGGRRQMAEAAAAAAREETSRVLKTANQAGPGDLLDADGYIFCAPDNLAAIAGVMKDFFDDRPQARDRRATVQMGNFD